MTAGDPMIEPRVHVVRSVTPETPGVFTLSVVPVDGAPTSFLPAQVSMLGAFGIGEAAISISSSATATLWQASRPSDCMPRFIASNDAAGTQVKNTSTPRMRSK